MSFNPGSYRPSEPKSLPVVLLLDVSGSMIGAKIDALHKAVVTMVDTFVAQRVKETCIKCSIITFGDKVELHYPCTNDIPYVEVTDLQSQGISNFDASGCTPLGAALTMAKDLIEDKSVTLGRWYAPAVVLVSDGQPDRGWESPFEEFIKDGRTSRCQKLAVAIGSDADKQMLKTFTGNSELMFYAEDSDHIADAFRKVTLSVTQRATQKNPDAGLPIDLNRKFDNGEMPVNGVRPSVTNKRKTVKKDDDEF